MRWKTAVSYGFHARLVVVLGIAGVVVVLGEGMFEPDPVGDHRDKLAVGRLAAAVLDGVAEVGIEHLDVAPVPRDLNRMADGAFDAGRSRLKIIGDCRVELFGNRVDDLHILQRENNRPTQVMVPFNVGRDANLVQDVGDDDFQLLFLLNESWLRLLEEAHGKRGKPITRYAIRKEPGVFDPGKLRANLEKLPQGFTLEPIDEELYHALLELDWARDFCAQFGSWEEYAAHGCGFVAIKDGQVAAGASSYTWYRGGIEIEIDTKAEYRRQGLALCCASALLLHCLERGLYPSWDAATPISVALAEKLGYHFSHAYPCLEIAVPTQKEDLG